MVITHLLNGRNPPSKVQPYKVGQYLTGTNLGTILEGDLLPGKQYKT